MLLCKVSTLTKENDTAAIKTYDCNSVDLRDNVGTMQTAAKTIRSVSPNGTGNAPILPQSYQGSLWRQVFSGHFEFPEWGKFKMTDSGRFSMPYAMLAILVSLLAIVIGAVITVGLAATIGVVSVLRSQTRMETQMDSMLRSQQSQESKIDGLKAYVNVQTRESDMVKNLLSPGQQQRIERWEQANPKPDLSKLGQQPQN